MKKYTYLGITFDSNSGFKTAIESLRKKATRGLFALKRSIMRDSISFDANIKLFDSLIKPILLYGCQVLAPHTSTFKNIAQSNYTLTDEKYFNYIQNDTYEKFHLKFLKWACGVHRKACNLGLWGDTGRIPLITNAIKLSIDYFDRAENSNPASLLYKSFTEQKHLNLEWFTNLTLMKQNFCHGNLNRVSINAIKNLRNQFVLNWNSALQKSTKLDFYKSIKTEFKREPYLRIKEFKHRSNVTKVRISAHQFKIEVGRYTIPLTPRNDRFCDYCCHVNAIRNVESELHIINDCELYTSLRQKIRTEITRPLLNIIKQSDDLAELLLAARHLSSILETHEAFRSYTQLMVKNSEEATMAQCRVF